MIWFMLEKDYGFRTGVGEIEPIGQILPIACIGKPVN